MDQFISTLARENTAMFLDCRDLTYSLVPLKTETRIIVCDSRVQRRLDSSEYNKRRTECEEAVRLLAGRLGPIQALRDVSPVQLTENESVLPELLLKRARHVVTENDRVVKSVEALEKGNVHRFGEFLFQSHQSLRKDYEVSCPELNLLVDLAASQPGTLGARMTGAGFGGCTVNLVEAGAVDHFCQGMKEGYLKESQIEPLIYVCRPSDGVSSRRLLS
jgi:galactokinase